MSETEDYERVPYPRVLYHVTRPDHLELMGRLFGVGPRPATEARVLEIGCALADSLLLSAECFPGARFVGIDLSPAQIAAGERLRSAAGLENVELRVLDLARVDASFGEFDYIVAHGVYSWVPAPLREKLLEVIRQRLAPRGVAFISHNVKPGWHAKALAREMMLYHTRGLADPRERVVAGRRFLEAVAAGAHPGERPYRAAVAAQSKQLAERADAAVLHDDLGEESDGNWLWEMVEHLEAYGLQFVTDANTQMLGTAGLPPEAVARMESLSTSVVEREQNLDFLRNRSLRMTLACHASLTLERELRPERLAEMHVGLDHRVQDLELAGARLMVRTASSRVPIEDPLARAAVTAIGQVWPGSLPFAELAARAGGDPRLPACLLDLFRGGIIGLAPRPPTFATTPPPRPRACALARAQAAEGDIVFNLRHSGSQLDEETRRVLRALDGTRDHATLARELGLDEAALGDVLARLARMALLHAG